ncbi:twin-arginine translocation pathway signal [Leptothrix cholodnii SP-6]|uniref:Twin-arginine translocation pathway signal n=1 Tax=Leptothrix cholodnii (strain ATCC 51168 / LMG 8142 / SP-6) TaxID=395495 RepID=B1Y7V7_LEPCP|nr:DUF1513 domain-containing protein [Leptothrix cholodnii]ACB32555.1 twin-arginine translocation pathway signal [Leptothrix cholodnii SP-6]
MHRRFFLQSSSLALLASWRPALQAGPPAEPMPRQRLAAAWRGRGADGIERDQVGVLDCDWAAGTVRVVGAIDNPGRAHGLLAGADGGFIAVANRPGRWLLAADRDGRLRQRLDLSQEPSARTLNGHVEADTSTGWLYTPETDPARGEGWISVRDPRSLRRVAQWPSHGVDPHQCLLDGDGGLIVANGGIWRTPQGHKVALERMAPSLVRLDARSGALLGQWRLADARLSIRHLAWTDDDSRRLGVALQAEHDTPQQRAEAPLLALWDGRSLQTPGARAPATAGGYAGDIAAGPGGGLILSGQKAGLGLWWHPGAPQRLQTVAELGDACALASFADAAERGVLIAAARGLARWHPRQAAQALPWPMPMAPDNHWVLLADA